MKPVRQLKLQLFLFPERQKEVLMDKAEKLCQITSLPIRNFFIMKIFVEKENENIAWNIYNH